MRPTITPTMKTATLLILLLAVQAVPSFAATGTLMPTPFQTLLDANGNPVSNGKICTYVAGTSTPATTYTDVGLTVPNANPIRSDTAGRFVVYLTPGQSYKFVYQDSSGTVGTCDGASIKTQDNVAAVPTSASSVDVTGTAGEAVGAGQCVYLSDGSGAKSAGQWYKCDSANSYSSTLPEVGIAPSAISSTASGTIRISGSVPGLSSLSIGAEYFVGTSGALTSTAPTLKRHLGHADTATSLVLTGDPAPPTTLVNNATNGFRVSASTGVCVSPTDVTAATSIFLVPCLGNAIALYDGTNWNIRTTAQISIAVPATTSQMYDVFVFDNSGTPTLELLAWTNDTTRATALTTQDGVLVKTGAVTRRYVGSCRTTTVSGQTEDSFAKRYVWNYYNRVPRSLKVLEATASWTYSTLTWRQARATATNQLDVVVGVAEVPIDISLSANATSTAADAAYISIGEDSTTTPSASAIYGKVSVSASGVQVTLAAHLTLFPAVGRHTYVWLEQAAAGGTMTWVGVNTGAAAAQSGLLGVIQG